MENYQISKELYDTMEMSWTWGLNKNQIEDIKKLEQACCEVEKLNMKLNWEMLCTRSLTERNDLLCYDGNRLTAFLGLYSMTENAKEIEITGMVHPDYRRTGIFSNLLEMALEECANRRAESVLLIAEKASEAGMGFVKSTKAEYAFSEYRMKSDFVIITAGIFR